MTRLRRFIAGAVCPNCGAMDRLFVHADETRRHQECSACGFSDSLDKAAGADDPAGAGEASVSIVRLIDP